MRTKQTDKKEVARTGQSRNLFLTTAVLYVGACGGGPEDVIQPPKNDAKVADASLSDAVRDSKAADLSKDGMAKDSMHLVLGDLKLADSSAKCALASMGKFTGLLAKGTTLSVGGYVFEYKGLDYNKNAVFDISCGGVNSATGQSCKPGATTKIDMKADNMTITIKVFVALANAVNLSVYVAPN